MLFQFPPLRISVRTIRRPLGLRVRFRLVHEVCHPSRDRLHQDLRAFPLEEFEHVEVAVALGNLRPELASNLNHRLHLGAVHFNAIHLFASGGQSIQIVPAPQMFVHLAEHIEGVSQNLVTLEFRLSPVRCPLFDLERIPILEILTESIHRLAEYALRLALLYFERTNLVDQVVEYVAQMHGIEHAESEVDRELQPGLARGGLDSIAVFKEQHTEAVEPRVLQCKAILGLIHAKPARTARTRREEDIVVQNVFARSAFLFQKLEILHEISNREISWIALPVVAILLADLKRRHVRHRELLATISTALEYRANQILVLPGEATKQNRHATTFFCREGSLDGTVEVGWLVKSGNLPQTHALCF